MPGNLVNTNSAEVRDFLQRAQVEGQDVVSTKGPPPPGAKYEDGDLIESINVSWRNVSTGEVVNMNWTINEH